MGHQEEGERGGEGGRGGEGAGQKPSPAHHRKGKNGGAMYLVNLKTFTCRVEKNQPTCVFFVQAPGRCEANQQPQRPQRKYCQAHDVASPICPTHHTCNRKYLHVQQDHRRTFSNGFEGLRPPGDGSWRQREPKNHKSSEPS